MGNLSDTPRASMPRFRFVTAGESLLNAPCYNLYSRSAGGEFLSLVRCWKLSGRSSEVGVEGVSLTRARVYQVFRRVGETLFQGLHWNLSHRAVGE